jgi:two-component system, NarL family, response regulator NreC
MRSAYLPETVASLLLAEKYRSMTLAQGREDMSIRVLVADDHQITREGIRTMLEKETGMELLGEAKDGRAAVEMVKELNPDVIIMDVCMPEMNGIVATSLILNEFPKIKVIALSMLCDKQYVLKMLRAGASAYLLKDCAFKELTQAIRMVLTNRTYLSPDVTDILVADYGTTPAPNNSADSHKLSLRESEVLQLIAEGKTTAQIASRLYVSIKTIETHRQNIMQKLNINSIAGLTKYAVREGLTSA